MLHIVSGIPEVGDVPSLNIGTVIFSLCKFSFFITRWNRFRPFLQGADPVREFYGQTNTKLMRDRPQCGLCWINHVSKDLSCMHFIKEAGLSGLFTTIVELTYKNQIRLSFQARANIPQRFQQIVKVYI